MPAFFHSNPISYSFSLTPSSRSPKAFAPPSLRAVIHILHKHNNKESAPSSKPIHPSHSIEEQTLNTLTCKTTNKTQMQKRK